MEHRLLATVLAAHPILREADTKPVQEVAKKHVGSLEPSDVKRLRQLEQENGRLNEDGGGP